MPTETIKTRGWNNAEKHKCEEVYDICCMVWNSIKRLPDDKNPQDLLATTAAEILDIGQKLLDDDTIWEELPNQIIPGLYSAKKDVLRKKLRTHLEESR